MYLDYLYYTTDEMNNKDVSDARSFIPHGSVNDFNRLLSLIIDSGVEGFAALAALYRWLIDRPQYRPIYDGLERYFNET